MAKRGLYIVVISFFGLLLCAIQHSDKKVDPSEYLKKYQENKESFIVSHTIDEIRYTAQIIPNELKLIHLDKIGVVNVENLKKFNEETNKSIEVLFQIELLDFNKEFLTYPNDNSMSYTERLEYFSFKMKDDISILIDSKYSLSCQDYIFERNFGSSPKASITLGFDLPKKYKTLQLIVNDKVFNNEDIQFEFTSNQLNVLPKLKNYNKWKK